MGGMSPAGKWLESWLVAFLMGQTPSCPWFPTVKKLMSFDCNLDLLLRLLSRMWGCMLVVSTQRPLGGLTWKAVRRSCQLGKEEWVGDKRGKRAGPGSLDILAPAIQLWPLRLDKLEGFPLLTFLRGIMLDPHQINLILLALCFLDFQIYYLTSMSGLDMAQWTCKMHR